VEPRTDYAIGVFIGTVMYGGAAGFVVSQLAGTAWGVVAGLAVAFAVYMRGVRQAA
jgi:hypothetical protein